MLTASNLSTEQIDLAQKQRVGLLYALYDLSDRNVHKPISLMEAAKKIGVTDVNEALSIASYLHAKGVFNLSGGGWGGRMTVAGIDLIEQSRKPISTQEKNPAAPSVVINNHNSPGANFNLGSGNIQQSWTELTSQQIDNAVATPEEKQKAKSLLAQISENKLLNTIIGSAVGVLTEAALPK